MSMNIFFGMRENKYANHEVKVSILIIYLHDFTYICSTIFQFWRSILPPSNNTPPWVGGWNMTFLPRTRVVFKISISKRPKREKQNLSLFFVWMLRSWICFFCLLHMYIYIHIYIHYIIYSYIYNYIHYIYIHMYMLTPLQPTKTAFPRVFTRNKCICPTCQKAQWSVNIAAFLKTEKGCC